MDLKQLKSFIAVANTLNFGRAARHFHLSQSALSIQIQNLDSHLGVSLLARNRRSVHLTAAGESILADSEQLLEQVTAIELRAARIGSGETGHCTLVLSLRQLLSFFRPSLLPSAKWAPTFYDHWNALYRKAGFTPNVVQETAEMEKALVLKHLPV